jgi:hypothetical protein
LELDEFERHAYFVQKPTNLYQGVIAEHAASVLDGVPMAGACGLHTSAM